MDPTLESDYGSGLSVVPQKPKLDKAGFKLLKKDRLEAQSSKTPLLPAFPQDPPEPP